MKAFPWSIDNGDSVRGENGMDLRDYFAAKAMEGLLDSKIIIEICQMTDDGNLTELVATMAYNMSDAMMKERGKQ